MSAEKTKDDVLVVKNLKQYFRMDKKHTVKAVDDVSFSIKRGSRKPRFARLPAVFCAFCQFFVFMKIFLRKHLFDDLIDQHVRRVFFHLSGCFFTL